MPKRRGQNNQNQRGDSDLAGKRSRPARRRKHLYLVLDDWNKGFSVHKIDTDSFDSDSDDDQGPRVAVAEHLPEPPALRLQSPGPHVPMLFTTAGSKIFVVTDARYGQTPALVYDTETAGLAIGPVVPAHLQCGFSIVVAVRETLYAFSSPACNEQLSFEVMSCAPTGLHDPSEEGWSWKSSPAPPSPFDIYEIITSYAVHPDGHTIYMTTSYRDRPNLQKSTYSFNTKYCAWRWHDWVLPFQGQGHFDSELDAWVGLHMDGYICSCQVTSDIGSETPVELGTTELEWQIVVEKFLNEQTERHLRASLTYMGRSKFCLVQSVIRKGAKEKYPLDDDDGCVLHLTIFGLKYNHKGEVQATNHRSTCSYRVSSHKDYFSPKAFWV
ncbi:uncharacterized protein LOC133892584 [Phragmites australis]|uniref:uncharacterized protein LOC133892584 n=1 Tax=Phragmites australis TaxID=29695 RepID=UPI002D76FCA0|nr:uncharacterized protein LOC133892584 [Phragmites australis]